MYSYNLLKSFVLRVFIQLIKVCRITFIMSDEVAHIERFNKITGEQPCQLVLQIGWLTRIDVIEMQRWMM